jgi:hypothetical protein
MAKTGKTLSEFNEEEIMVMINTAAKIAAKLQKIKETYREPKIFASKVLKDLEHKKNIAFAFTIFNFSNMDHRRFYRPQDLKTEITKHMQTSTIKNDTTDLLAATEDKLVTNSEYVSSKDITKSLKALENEIGLINIKGKDKIKKAKGTQQIQFLGKPSLYKLPHNSEGLKKIMSKPKAIELIFKSLVNMGLLSHLEFIWEASFYVTRDQGSTYELGKLAEKLVDHLNLKIDQQNWSFYQNLLLSIPEDRLGILAHKLSELSANHPELYRFILLLGLSISP